MLVSQHNRQTVFSTGFNHSLESIVGLCKIFSLLLRRVVLLLVSSQIFGTEHITVRDIGLVAQQLQIFLEDFDTLLSLLVAYIQVGKFVIIRASLIHVFFLLLVLGQLRIFGFQILYSQEKVTDGFVQVALFLGQLPGKVIVHIEVNGVGELLVLDVGSCFFSGCHSPIIVHGQLYLLELGEEVHTGNEDIVGSKGFQHSCHLNHLVQVGVVGGRHGEESLKVVFARTYIQLTFLLGNCCVISSIALDGITILVKLVVNVTQIAVCLYIARVDLLDFVECINCHMGIHVFVNESIALQGGYVDRVNGEDFVELLSGITPALGLHEHFAGKHQTGNVSGV